jgi:lipopolysaccharide transport system ATP-binding protein
MAGRQLEVVDVGQAVTLRVDVKAHADLDRLVLGYGIKDRLGQVVYGTNTDLTKQPLHAVKAGDVVRFEMSFAANLGPGTYSIQTALVSTDTHLVNNYEWRDLALIFNVININKSNFAGVAWMPPEIAISYP